MESETFLKILKSEFQEYTEIKWNRSRYDYKGDYDEWVLKGPADWTDNETKADLSCYDCNQHEGFFITKEKVDKSSLVKHFYCKLCLMGFIKASFFFKYQIAVNNAQQVLQNKCEKDTFLFNFYLPDGSMKEVSVKAKIKKVPDLVLNKGEVTNEGWGYKTCYVCEENLIKLGSKSIYSYQYEHHYYCKKCSLFFTHTYISSESKNNYDEMNPKALEVMNKKMETFTEAYKFVSEKEESIISFAYNEKLTIDSSLKASQAHCYSCNQYLYLYETKHPDVMYADQVDQKYFYCRACRLIMLDEYIHYAN
jgi:hypothetical protein